MSLKAQLDRWFRQKETGWSGEKQQTVALIPIAVLYLINAMG